MVKKIALGLYHNTKYTIAWTTLYKIGGTVQIHLYLNLSEQIDSLTKQSNCNDDKKEVLRLKLVKWLEEMNDALSQCISLLQVTWDSI